MKDENNLLLLPENIRCLSLSEREIVLPYHEVMEALGLLKSKEIGFLGWEGWAKYDEMRKGHFGDFTTESFDWMEGEDWNSYVNRGYEFCKKTIEQAYTKWTTEYPPLPQLYFCLSVASKKWYLELRSNR